MKMTSDTEKTEYLNLKCLKDRGWTASLVKNFLGDPDKLKPNPFYRSAAPQKLYLLSRIVEVEALADFQKKKVACEARSKVAQARADVARQALIKDVLSKVRVSKMSLEALRRKALSEKREWDMMRGNYEVDPQYAEEHHIHRWMVNYARHNLSNYDDVRSVYFGKVGVHDAAEIARDAILDIIAQRWPELEEACRDARRDSDPYQIS